MAFDLTKVNIPNKICKKISEGILYGGSEEDDING